MVSSRGHGSVSSASADAILGVVPDTTLCHNAPCRKCIFIGTWSVFHEDSEPLDEVFFYYLQRGKTAPLTLFAMRIDIISCCPELLESPLNHSIVQRAKDKGLVEVYVHNLRDYTLDKHRKVDDYAFGFGAGMVLQIEPIDRCISQLTSERHYDEIIFTAPDGERFDQPAANRLSLVENIIILCGHYKGVDQRVRDHFITKEYTIGDFVLTGGEMPAAIMTDAIVRLLPGALGDVESALNDSFQDGLLEPGVYTRPAEYKGWKVPEILISGNQRKIEEWQYEEAIRHTRERRPDLLEKNGLA